MGAASGGTCGPWSVSWKMQSTGGLDRDRLRADWPALDLSAYAARGRVFRVTERKTDREEKQ